MLSNISRHSLSFRLISWLISTQPVKIKAKVRTSVRELLLLSISRQTSSQKSQSRGSGRSLVRQYGGNIGISSSTKSHKAKQALWSYKDVFRAPSLRILQNDSMNNCFVSCCIEESARKSRRVMISLLSDINISELVCLRGRLADVSAPSSRSSNVAVAVL